MNFDVAFFGNSLTRGSDFQLYFPDKRIINLGYSGDDLEGMKRRLPMLKAASPSKIFIMGGTNDLCNMNLDEYKERYEQLLKQIQDAIPGVMIYVQSVLPSNHELGEYAPNEKIQAGNAIVKNIAKELKCTYINIYDLYVDKDNELPKRFTTDGVHLYPRSYDIWAKAITPYIYEPQ